MSLEPREAERQLVVLGNLQDALFHELSKRVVGQRAVLEGLLVAILAGGHVLLEGMPGTAKTLMIHSFAEVLGLSFGRIQFTPDLMPSDILGVNIFDLPSGQFRLTRGPIFTELLLADEINRAPAKTQSALLEAMQERQVTIDGSSHPLSSAFTVFATQNPIEQEGTYPLPEAQLDRFLLKLRVPYPSSEEEDAILEQAASGDVAGVDQSPLKQVLPTHGLTTCREAVRCVTVDARVRAYLRDLVRATRSSEMILLGAGPRAGVHLMWVSRWYAALAGRMFVTPDDIQRALFPVLGHRLALAPEVELDGLSVEEVLEQVAKAVAVPR